MPKVRASVSIPKFSITSLDAHRALSSVKLTPPLIPSRCIGLGAKKLDVGTDGKLGTSAQ